MASSLSLSCSPRIRPVSHSRSLLRFIHPRLTSCPILTVPTGKIDYSLSLGKASLKPDAPDATPQTLLLMASLSKLITAVAILVLVDQKLLELDDDAGKYLPKLAKQPIVTSVIDGKPQLVQRTKPILVRHLLTHSAGTGYILLNPTLTHWAEATGRKLPLPLKSALDGGGAAVDSRFGYPLVFEPGTGWEYGSGLDWLGKLIEVMAGVFLDDFVHEHIFEKVGIPRGGITFHPGRFTDPIEPLAGMAARTAPNGQVQFLDTRFDSVAEAFGGEGAWGGMGEYIKVLESLMKNDGKILKPETCDLLFTGLLEGEAKKALNETMKHPEWVVGVVPQGVEYNWSAGGLLMEDGKHEHRKKGFLQWGGAWNLSWVSTWLTTVLL